MSDTLERKRFFEALGQGLVAVVVAGLFVVACASPLRDGRPMFGAHPPPDSIRPDPGFMALLFGWFPPFTIPWLANVFLLVGWVLLAMRKYGGAFLSASLASVLGLTTWLFMDGERLYVAAYLWEGSLLVLAAGALVLVLARRTGQQAPPRNEPATEPHPLDPSGDGQERGVS